MKRNFAITCITALLVLFSVGCSQKADEKTMPTDQEIVEALSDCLEDTVYQDPAAYPSLNDFLQANLGLTEQDVSDAVLYMGAPNQNTTFFLILTKTEDGDTQQILEKLENKMKAQVETAEMGYMTGYTEYDIIEKENKIFAIMNQDAEKFTQMQTYCNEL